MIRRYIISIVLAAIGTACIFSAIRSWKEDPVRTFMAVKGTIVEHQVRVDDQRWKDGTSQAIHVSTQVRVTDPNLVPDHAKDVHLSEYFSKGSEAGQFVSAHPTGSVVHGLVPADGKEGLWSGHTSNLPIIWLAMGVVIVFIAMARHGPHIGNGARNAFLMLLISLGFLTIGVVLSAQIWREAWNHIQAAHWPEVPARHIAERALHGHKSSSRQWAISYVHNGVGIQSIVAPNVNSNKPPPAELRCRINPTNPWEAALEWGWTPGLGIVLFPFPFLAIGIAGLGSLLYAWLNERQLLMTHGLEGVLIPSIKDHDLVPLLSSVFGLVFVGSIVGVFVSLCAEMWIHQRLERWILTPVLIPAVFIVAKMMRSVVVESMRLLRPPQEGKSPPHPETVI